MRVAVPTDVNKLSFSAHFAWDLAACTSFSLSWSCTGPAPRILLCRQIADLPFQAVGRESAESPQNVALESPRSIQASAWAGPPTSPPQFTPLNGGALSVGFRPSRPPDVCGKKPAGRFQLLPGDKTPVLVPRPDGRRLVAIDCRAAAPSCRRLSEVWGKPPVGVTQTTA